MGIRHRCGAAAAAAAFTLIALVGWAGPASAHTNLLGTDPADGAAIEQSPPNVTLVFSENVEVQLTRVQITNGAGVAVAIGPLARDPQHPTQLLVPLPAKLPADTYRVVFTTRDSTDLHETSGAIVFGVATVPPAAVSSITSTGTRPAEVVLRWISRAGLALILGALAFIVFVLGSGDLPAPDDGVPVTIRRRRQLRLVLVGAALVAFAESGILVLQASDIGSLGSSLPRVLLHSEFGSRWILTVVVLLGLGLFLPALGRRYTAMKGRLAFGVAMVLGGIGAISGHSGGNSGVLSVRIALRALHLVSVGIWAGGLVALLVALSPARAVASQALSGDASRRMRIALVTRFGELALVAFAGAVVSGILLAGEQVSTVTALLSTLYGAALLVKVALLGLVAIVGFRHAWRVRRGQRRSVNGSASALSVARAPVTRRSLTIEVVGALLVIGLGATLGATSPARGPRFDPPPTDVFPTTLSIQQGDLLVRVSIKPNRPGRNLLSADLTSTRRPPGPAVTGVTFRLRTPGGDLAGEEFKGVTAAAPVTLSSPSANAGNSAGFRATPTSHFEVPVQLTPGDLGVTAVLDRGSVQPERVDLHWTVNPRGVKRAPTVLSDARLSGWTLSLGLVALALGLVGAALDIRRRHRNRRDSSAGQPAAGSGTGSLQAPEPTTETSPPSEPAGAEAVGSGVGGDVR